MAYLKVLSNRCRAVCTPSVRHVSYPAMPFRARDNTLHQPAATDTSPRVVRHQRCSNRWDTRPLSLTECTSPLGPTDGSDSPSGQDSIPQLILPGDPEFTLGSSSAPLETPTASFQHPIPLNNALLKATPHPVRPDLGPPLLKSTPTPAPSSQLPASGTSPPNTLPASAAPEGRPSVLPQAQALADAVAQLQLDLAPRAAAIAEAVANLRNDLKNDLPPQAAALAESITQLQKDLHQQAVLLSTPPHAEVTPPNYRPAFEDLPPTAGGEHLHRSSPGVAAASLFQVLWDRAYRGVMLFLVFGGVVVLGLVRWSSGQVQARPSPYTFTVHIAQAPGVHVGVPLHLQGVQVGRVIKVEPKVQHVSMEVEVNSAATHIPLGSLVDFNVHGMFSAPLIDVVLPKGMDKPALDAARSPRDVGACNQQELLVCQGGVVQGRAGGSTDEMLQRFVLKHRKDHRGEL